MAHVERTVLITCVAVALMAAVGCNRATRPAAVAEAPPPAALPDPPPPPPPPPPAPAPVAAAPALTEDELFARKTLDELNAESPLDLVLFDLDEAVLRADARTLLQRNAEWLRRWPSTRVTIEGHCDERGTPEYNLALGERRALSVQQYLQSLGISADRLQTLSKGKEVPVCQDAQEACWQRNRRAQFLFTAK